MQSGKPSPIGYVILVKVGSNNLVNTPPRRDATKASENEVSGKKDHWRWSGECARIKGLGRSGLKQGNEN
jgi:hypothetical protein